MIKTVIAMEQDGFDTRAVVFNFEVTSNDFDIRSAVEAACIEYCQTEEGRRTYEGNCDCFNWGDFDAYVPDTICQKHGFKKIPSDSTDVIVNFDEQLVDDSEVDC